MSGTPTSMPNSARSIMLGIRQMSRLPYYAGISARWGAVRTVNGSPRQVRIRSSPRRTANARRTVATLTLCDRTTRARSATSSPERTHPAGCNDAVGRPDGGTAIGHPSDLACRAKALPACRSACSPANPSRRSRTYRQAALRQARRLLRQVQPRESTMHRRHLQSIWTATRRPPSPPIARIAARQSPPVVSTARGTNLVWWRR